jgi:hypothetical protein
MKASVSEYEARSEIAPTPQLLLRPIEANASSMMDIISSFKSDAAAQKDMVNVVGRVLDRTVQLNDAKGAGDTAYGCAHPLFHSTRTCPLQPSAYVQRILQYSAASPCNFVIATVFLQRVKQMRRKGANDTVLRLTSYNIQRLLLTAVMLACKMYDEPFVNNKQWAAIGDVSVQEMNALELELLFHLKFSLVISREEYDKCQVALFEIEQAYYPCIPRDAQIKKKRQEIERPRSIESPKEALHEVPQGPQTPVSASCWADSDERDETSSNSSSNRFSRLNSCASSIDDTFFVGNAIDSLVV